MASSCRSFHVQFEILWLRYFSLQLEKFERCRFGRCPRIYCRDQPCLPVGQSDIPGSRLLKIYCPKCEDIYHPESKYQGSILIYFIFFFAFLFVNVCEYIPSVFDFCIYLLHAVSSFAETHF